MNSQRLFFFIGLMFTTATLAASASGSAAPATRAALGVVPPLSSNAVPKSVFVVPASEKDGRDPFYPQSDRLQHGSNKKSAAAPKTPSIELVYNGLSGTADRRLAIINGRTLAEGEETELVLPTGRVKIRCIEIKGETVIVEAFGERRELRLGAGK
jgi:hypothetical protein